MSAMQFVDTSHMPAKALPTSLPDMESETKVIITITITIIYQNYYNYHTTSNYVTRY